MAPRHDDSALDFELGSEALEALRHRLEGFSQPVADADASAAGEAKRQLAERVPPDLLHLLRPGWELLEPVRIGPPEALLARQRQLAATIPEGAELTLVGSEHDGTPFGFVRGAATVARLVDGGVRDTGATLVQWLERQLEVAMPRLWSGAVDRLSARGAGDSLAEGDLVEIERRAGSVHPPALRAFLREVGRISWPLTIAPLTEVRPPGSAPAAVRWFGVRDGVFFGFNPSDDGNDDLVVSFDPADEDLEEFVEDSFRWWLLAEVSIAEQAERAPVSSTADAGPPGPSVERAQSDDDDEDGLFAAGALEAELSAPPDALAERLLAGLGLADEVPAEDTTGDGPGGVVGELLEVLIDRSWLELDTPRSLSELAVRVEAMLEREGPLALRDLDEWLLEQDEVVELYCDREQLLALARELAGA